MTLSLTINETFKWLSSLPVLMQESFWWWLCSGRYIISLFPHLHAPFNPYPHPDLPVPINLMVSVDVNPFAAIWTSYDVTGKALSIDL